MALTRDERRQDDSGHTPRRSRVLALWGLVRMARRAVKLAIVAGVVVLLVLVIGLVVALPHLSNPFKTKTIDRSQPVLLLSIQDVARFEAAAGNFQVVVDVKHDKAYIPDILFSEHSLFVAAGSVNAFVDFSTLSAGNVVTSPDNKTATITLPVPQLEPPSIDLAKSYVFSDSKGLINKVQDMFDNDPNEQKKLYQLADQKITAAATASHLVQTAETNTTAMLNHLLGALGFTTITVNFRPS
jgi:hypothetical protein